MTFQQELSSWLWPSKLEVSSIPDVGDKAPSTTKLQLPSPDGKPVLLALLRHCGCPWAERAFRSLRSIAQQRPDVRCVAVSHSDQQATDNWLDAVGGRGNVEVIVDSERNIYANWGLGASSAYHFLNPWALYNVYRVGKDEGIWNKPTESGSRWQRSGQFAIDREGKVVWSRPAQTADESAELEEGVKTLG